MIQDLEIKLEEAGYYKSEVESSREYLEHKKNVKSSYLIAGGLALFSGLSFLGTFMVIGYTEFKLNRKRRELVGRLVALERDKKHK